MPKVRLTKPMREILMAPVRESRYGNRSPDLGVHGPVKVAAAERLEALGLVEIAEKNERRWAAVHFTAEGFAEGRALRKAAREEGNWGLAGPPRQG